MPNETRIIPARILCRIGNGSDDRGSDAMISSEYDGLKRFIEDYEPTKESTMTDETTLLPCPFCGKEVKVEEYQACIDGKMIGEHPLYWVECHNKDDAGNHIAETPLFNTREQAIEAWNTRYEHTCKLDKTCECGCGRYVCSNCNEVMEPYTPKNYCPNCGAKVTKECTMYRVALYDEESIESIECSECGWSGFHDHDEPLPEICPNCKARVIEE